MVTGLHVTQQRSFTNPADYEAFSLIRVHNQRLAPLGGRNAWVVLKTNAGKRCCRMIRGIGRDPGFPEDGIEIDYETRLALQIPKSSINMQGFHGCAMEIRRATALEVLRAHWDHPDPAYRIPLQISLVSFVLGVIGLGLGVLSLK
ncbi:hypothetical protein D3C87_1529600 [compost metagenome]|uniref:Uncharacterized protein n=1 Tax=Variovorax boronicumulans TaxID=436515 RepID=A0A250DQF0_9BURK|nr:MULTISPECIES: hypothetical protein [Variovorax]ATA56311.1 hypothetical protein CKY39_26085 [Variovorax boronicumulans]MDP9918049.1 hypothetical protein [Variovorax boronicumulans]TSD56174.1 hypothetical protein FFI97_018150 [Variovorax sp. KBS0712]GER09193.1 hypothetical protein VHAB30_03390 [Variovorax boronicumulans]GER18169.1 hypothetical protein VCH24_31930 [Variovorax boronicumulans]